MKKWPLRWKVACYSALFALCATLAGALTTSVIMRYSELADFDRRLSIGTQEFFRDIENFERDPNKTPGAFEERFVPLAMRQHLLEVFNEQGQLLYRSPNLRHPLPNDSISTFHTIRVGGRDVRLAEFRSGGLLVRVGGDLRELNRYAHHLFLGMLAAIPTVVFVVVVGASWVASKAIAPVEELRKAASEITPQHLERRLPVPPTRDEIAGLIRVLNATFDRLQRSFEQAMRFSADASHHLKTPIAVLRAGVEEILHDTECNARTQEMAEGLLDRIHHLTSVTDNLLLLARADAGRLILRAEEFDLTEVLEGMIDDARALAEPHDLTVEADYPKHLPITADRVYVGMITQNLLENAVKFNRPGGRIKVAARMINSSIEMTVGNTGDGIPNDKRGQLFERFYRVRGDERVGGTGLGLSTARELARAHGGEVELRSSDDNWTEISVRLPKAA